MSTPPDRPASQPDADSESPIDPRETTASRDSLNSRDVVNSRDVASSRDELPATEQLSPPCHRSCEPETRERNGAGGSAPNSSRFSTATFADLPDAAGSHPLSPADLTPANPGQPNGDDTANGRQQLKQKIRERTQQLQRQGPPVSFSERSSLQEVRPGEAVPQPDPAWSIKALQQLPLADIRSHVRQEGLDLADGLSRREMLLQIIRHRIKAKGLMYGEGTLQVLPDGFGFLRSPDAHYISCQDDIYVSPSQIRKFNLRTGCTVCGQVRPPKENERFFALLRVELVNGRTPDVHSRSKSFDHLTPLHPDRRILMEHDPEELSTRLVDLLAPIGFGQRGLIASPPRAGKTVLLQQMARAVLKNHPDCYVILLLIDERPEEVTDMVREVRSSRCEVISSTFDESPLRHIQVAEMVLEKCKCLVETGVDVVLFLDSITRLARAWNAECPPSGRLLSGGLDANALHKPKALFGAARKLEEGGSLTIIATALIQTGSQLDEVIYEEFKGTGNLEILLDKALVERRIWPAFDLSGSGTRREEKLFADEEYAQVCQLRRELASRQATDALEQLLERLRKTRTNAEFLLRLQNGHS